MVLPLLLCSASRIVSYNDRSSGRQLLVNSKSKKTGQELFNVGSSASKFL